MKPGRILAMLPRALSTMRKQTKELQIHDPEQARKIRVLTVLEKRFEFEIGNQQKEHNADAARAATDAAMATNIGVRASLHRILKLADQ